MPDGQDHPLDTQIEQQSEIAEHIFGIVAKREGKPRDERRSTAWLRGWDEGSVEDYTLSSAEGLKRASSP